MIQSCVSHCRLNGTKYIGGILGVGVHDFQDDVKTFKKIGFDRVYPPEADVKKSVLDLCNDLTERGIL